MLDPYDRLVVYKAHAGLSLEKLAQVGGAQMDLPRHLFEAYIACEIAFNYLLGFFDKVIIDLRVFIMIKIENMLEQIFYVFLQAFQEKRSTNPVVRMYPRNNGFMTDKGDLDVKQDDYGLYKLPEEFFYQFGSHIAV